MNSDPQNPVHCIDVCNRLLRGELSAVETYNQVLRKFEGESHVGPLSHIRDEHARSAEVLQENIRQMGGRPDHDSGAWGSFANAIQGAANLFGENSAVCSLQAVEKKGREDYEKALADVEVMTGCREVIEAVLLPRINNHISVLDGLNGG